MAIIVSASKTFDNTRCAADAPVASCHGYDIMAGLNGYYERINESAGGGEAPGAAASTLAGHVHDSNGLGRGIMRIVNGAFYLVAAPLTYEHTGANASISAGAPGAYPLDAGAGDYEMGVAYVSAGVTSIKVAFQAKVSSVTDAPTLTVHNITDGTSSAATALTVDPCWYAVTVAVTHPGSGLYRITLDLICHVDANTRTFYLYEAFPYEYQDEA